MKTDALNLIPRHPPFHECGDGAREEADASEQGLREQSVRPVSATFRNILLVVSLLLVFAAVQMFTLWRVCQGGMKTAATLERQGLPTLDALASLQEDLAIYRLRSYEYLFAREGENAEKAKAVEAIATQMHTELQRMKLLLPEGEGRRLASNLEEAITDLDEEFRKVRDLVNRDFPSAMKAMDENIPPRTERVSAAAVKLRDHGYTVSGTEANATFGSFGWIRYNAVLFGAANILVVFGAMMFVKIAAHRSRAQLSETLDRLDERTRELAGSLSVLHATLESTADGILAVRTYGEVICNNSQFESMWGLPAEVMAQRKGTDIAEFISAQVTDPEGYVKRIEENRRSSDLNAFDVIELKDGRTFERYAKSQRMNGMVMGSVINFRDISERKKAEEELEKTHRELLETSRHAGMAEVATGVLHNIGNVLNSVNVSAELVAESIRKSKVSSLGRAVTLMETHAADLGAFITTDAQGKQLPPYLRQLHDWLLKEQRGALAEVNSLRNNIEHIKVIVAMQQEYAKVSGVTEMLQVTDLIDDCLRMNESALDRHSVEVVREYEEIPPIRIEKHKALQILVNLIRNAKYACDDTGRNDKRITVRAMKANGTLNISVEDNGIGIPAENLTRIFNHGFTTRKTGHGFGLHSGALAAREMGGALRVESEGVGKGATFILELPLHPEDAAA